MKRSIAILLLIALLITPVYAEAGYTDEDIFALAMAPLMMLDFEYSHATFHAPDGEISEESPVGESIPYYDAAGNLWREEYDNGYMMHHYTPVEVPYDRTPQNPFDTLPRDQEPEPTPDHVMVEAYTVLTADGRMEDYCAYEYDDQGRVTSERTGAQHIDYTYFTDGGVREVHYNADGSPFYVFETRRHPNGENAYVYQRYYDEGAAYSEEYYNEVGNPTLKIHCSRDGIITDRTEYFYDAGGVFLGDCTYEAAGELISYRHRTLNEDGQTAVQETSSSYKENARTTHYTYNDEGTLILQQSYDAEGELTTETSYTDFGEPLETKSSYRNGKPKFRTTYNYDENQRLTMARFYKNSKLDSVSTYDSAGNQVRTITMKRSGIDTWHDQLYNENGDCIFACGRDAQGQLLWWAVYGHEENEWSYVRLGTDGQLSHHVEHYEPMNDGLEYATWVNGAPQRIISVENGVTYTRTWNRLTGELETEWSSQVIEHRDAAGNVTQQEKYYDGVLFSTTYQAWARIADMPVAKNEPAPVESVDPTKQLDEHGFVLREETAGGYTTYTRNRTGNATAAYHYDAAGNFLRGTEYAYSAGGGIVTERTYRNDQGDYTQVIAREYDIMQRLLKETTYEGDGTTPVQCTEWDYTDAYLDHYSKRTETSYTDGEAVSRVETRYKQGEISQVRRYSLDGEAQTLLERIYWDWTRNDEGLPLYGTAHDGDGNFLQRTDYVYGAYENILWTQTIDAEGEILSRTDYFYDDDGNLITIR